MATALPETAQEGFKNTQTQSFFLISPESETAFTGCTETSQSIPMRLKVHPATDRIQMSHCQMSGISDYRSQLLGGSFGDLNHTILNK